MIVSYCFSSPDGDVTADDATLDRPFILEPFKNHPFLRLRDYFVAVHHFILGEKGTSLTSLLGSLWGWDVRLDDIDTIVVRYEKYGTLYQIASVDVAVRDQRIKLAVSTAVTQEAKQALSHEFDLLQYLYSQTGLPYLPAVYWKGPVNAYKQEGAETFLMVISEWFEGYHEWHFSIDEENRERILIWDMGGGYRFASEHQAHDIIKQATKILTLYYNPESYHRIFPWHHGAGDFVVATRDDAVDVRLVTARGYDPLQLPKDEINLALPGLAGLAGPLQALMLFLLETTVKMRLDKDEGMGDSIWAGASLLEAVIDGLFQALRVKERWTDGPTIRADTFKNFLGSFTENDIRLLLQEQTGTYCQPGSSDYEVVRGHLDQHASEVYRAIRSFSK